VHGLGCGVLFYFDPFITRGASADEESDEDGVCRLRNEFMDLADRHKVVVCNLADDDIFDVCTVTSFVPAMFPNRTYDRGMVTHYRVDAHLVESYFPPESRCTPEEFLRRNKTWQLMGFGSKVHASRSVDDPPIKEWRDLFVSLPGVTEPFYSLCGVVWPHWVPK
jgi:hypothetical protein